MTDKREEYRYLIDEADKEIIGWLQYRQSVARVMKSYKEKNQLPAKDLDREEEIINRYEIDLGEKGRAIAKVILE